MPFILLILSIDKGSINMKDFKTCTTMLVGKAASTDGSTIVGRNEDIREPKFPIKFLVRPAHDNQNQTFTSEKTGVKIPLPKHAYRYTCQPVAMSGFSNHAYEEGGVNEKNVCMSATETTSNNQQFLKADPLTKYGLNEIDMPTVILPYINSAQDGVKRLGKLLEKYGTGESNGIIFSDKNEIWYVETAGGHHWVAQRIPDDCYAIAPNQMMIQNVDFDDPKNFMWSPDLPEFVKQHHLNPDLKEFNWRHIAGTRTTHDLHFSNGRAWYGQRMFTSSAKQSPMDPEIPFLHHPDHKLSIVDVEKFLSSHYQGTPYDPYGKDKVHHYKFRPVGVSTNRASHILQIRNDRNLKYSCVEWLGLGNLVFSPYVPFYTNISQTPANYQTAGDHFDRHSAYWMYELLQSLVIPHYHGLIKTVNQYREACQSDEFKLLNHFDQQAKQIQPDQMTNFLTKASFKMANHITYKTQTLIRQLIEETLALQNDQYIKNYSTPPRKY